MEETQQEMTQEAATTPEGQDASQPVTTENATALTSANPESPEQTSEEQSAEAVKQSAPEQYEEFKSPEGVTLDSQALENFSEVARELNLSQDDAQKVIDKMAPAMAARNEEVMTQLREQWLSDTSSDKEFGGEKLNENLGMAKKALDTFGSPELTQLLNETGLGNHPEVIRVFYRAGKAISEDGFVKGQGTEAREQDPAKRLFPNQL